MRLAGGGAHPRDHAGAKPPRQPNRHPRRVGLQVHPHRARSSPRQRRGPPRTPPSPRPRRPDPGQQHLNPTLNTQLNAFDHRPLDPEQPLPYPVPRTPSLAAVLDSSTSPEPSQGTACAHMILLSHLRQRDKSLYTGRPMIDETCDFVIVGAGVIGMSAALALADRGASVICVERSTPGTGQSGGACRNFRHLHREPRLIQYAVTARAAWKDWEARWDASLVSEGGSLHLGKSAKDDADRLRAEGVICEVMSGSQVSRFLPTRGQWDSDFLWDTSAGVIDAEQTLELLALEVRPRTGQEVLGLSDGAAGTQVITSTGTISCGAILIAAGVDTGRMAADVGLSIDIQMALHLRLTFALDAFSVQFPPPAFVDNTQEFGVAVYGGFAASGAHRC